MRTILPALIAALVHAAILVGFLSVKAHKPALEDGETLPIAWIEMPRAPASSLPAVPGVAMRAPVLTFPVPEISPAPLVAPAGPDLSVLGGYLGCGVDRALNEEERARCDQARTELYANPNAKVNPNYDLALERRFARAKEIEDAPKLLPCFTPVGPNPICLFALMMGEEVKVGSYANRGPPENPLAQPVFPYRAK